MWSQPNLARQMCPPPVDMNIPLSVAPCPVEPPGNRPPGQFKGGPNRAEQPRREQRLFCINRRGRQKAKQAEGPLPGEARRVHANTRGEEGSMEGPMSWRA